MKEALKALIHEMEYVLSCINADEIPFDGDDFHEALRLGKEALDQLAQPEQEPAKYKFSIGCRACGHLESYDMEVNGLTTPPQRKPLTDKQLNIIGSRWHLNLLGTDEKAELFAFARAIEAAHGIKE